MHYGNYSSLSQVFYMNFSYLFSPRILDERKRLGLNQQKAGESCGVSREMWGKYERGKAVMGTEVLSKFALVGADALYILTGQRSDTTPIAPPPVSSNLSREEEVLLDNFRRSSAKARAALKRQAMRLRNEI